jgi:hypothetical protein
MATQKSNATTREQAIPLEIETETQSLGPLADNSSVRRNLSKSRCSIRGSWPPSSRHQTERTRNGHRKS